MDGLSIISGPIWCSFMARSGRTFHIVMKWMSRELGCELGFQVARGDRL